MDLQVVAKKQEEIQRLQEQLTEKEELVQMLIDQQLKQHSITDGDHECGVSPPVDQSEEKSKLCQLQLELDNLRQLSENNVFELTEKDEEIRVLKERCETRHQRIKCLEQQKRDVSEQAKKFEIDYRATLEEKQLLESEIKKLDHRLEARSNLAELSDKDGVQDINGEGVNHEGVITNFKVRIKELNDDVSKLREHSKEQSRQILVYRQQAEMTEVYIVTVHVCVTS